MKEKNIQKAHQLYGSMNQNCTINNYNMMSKIHELMKLGDIDGIMELLEEEHRVIGTYHPYYPYYTIDIKEVPGKKVPYSKPLSEEAKTKFPPALKGKFNESKGTVRNNNNTTHTTNYF